MDHFVDYGVQLPTPPPVMEDIGDTHHPHYIVTEAQQATRIRVQGQFLFYPPLTPPYQELPSFSFQSAAADRLLL